MQGPPVQAAALAPSFGVVTAASEPGDPSGRWVGVMDLGGKSQAVFRFDLRAANGLLSGTASVPIGEAGIVNGRVRDKHVTFETPQPFTENPFHDVKFARRKRRVNIPFLEN